MERKKTYYAVLGVSSTESDSGIRLAYRDLARKLHPDIAGEHATRSFQEISEAYGVLSDPRRRREYNQQLSSAEARGVVAVRRPPPPPLVSSAVPIFANRDGTRRSSLVCERFPRNFTGMGIPNSAWPTGLDFEVLLTPEEASRGCVVPVGVPVFSRCPQCGGSGRIWVFPCAYCQQSGMLELEQLLRITIPPMALSGLTYEIPLQGLGICHVYLRLHILVEAQTG